MGFFDVALVIGQYTICSLQLMLLQDGYFVWFDPLNLNVVIILHDIPLVIGQLNI